MAWQDYLDTVQKLYVAYYQRPADPQGLRYWAQVIEDYGIDAAVKGFVNSPEAQSLYQGDIEAVIKAVYNSAFGRDPEPDGLNYWKGVYEKGWADTGTIVWAIVNGAKGIDAIVLENKVESANNFTKAIDPDLDGIGPFNATYSGDADAAAAREFLKDVNATTVKTESQAESFIKEKIADEGDIIASKETITGTEFTMTHDIETLQGTNSDDLFKGIVDLANTDNTTFQAGDKIIGGAGNDKVDVTIVAAPVGGGTVTPVDISGVETISFSDVTGRNNIINAIYFKDNPTISVYNVGGETGIDNLSLDSKVVFSGMGDLSIDYFGASGTNDTVTVGLENAGVSKTATSTLFISDTDDANGIVTANIENLVLDTTGKNYVQIGDDTSDQDTLASVKVTGDGENYIVLKDVGDGATKTGAQFTFDASEATGNITVVDDAIIDDTPAAATAGDSAEITYKLGSGDDTVVFKADGFAGGAAIAPAVGDTDANNDKIDGGEGTDTLKFDVSVHIVNYTGVKDADLVNVEKIVVYNGTTTNGATIDLSKQTEGFEITGDDGGDTIVGGSGADTIDGGKGADTITGGKGADKITTGAGADTVVLDSPFNAADKITDFTSGTDTLKIDLTTEGAVGALGAGKFGGDNAVDLAYLVGSGTPTLKVFQFSAGGKLSKTANLVNITTGSKPLTANQWLKGKSINFKASKITLNGTTTLSAKSIAATKTAVLFFYDTDDHVLKMYGLAVKNTGGSGKTLEKLSKLTVKTIAQFTSGHEPEAAVGDIVIF